MTTALSSLTAREFDAYCAGIDTDAAEARENGITAEHVLRAGDEAVAEVNERRGQK
jgi:hypothetical protein